MSSAVTGLCLVEPAAFGFNAGTAGTNRFQQRPAGLDASAAAAAARAEFHTLVGALSARGIPLAIAADTPEPPKPDAVFPNNWVSFHADGTVVLYPMYDPARRAERREPVIQQVKRQLGFVERRRFDLSSEERSGRFLEGTGSLVLDHQHRIAYACRSPRTDPGLLAEWARLMGYETFLFDAATRDGVPVYHTNVVMWLGSRIAGVGLEWVAAEHRAALADRLRATGRELLPLADAQLHDFAGNMLQVDGAGQRHLLMSARAAASLDAPQRRQIAQAGLQPVTAALPVIEQLGGGSIRCMVAEVPLAAGESAT
ncbi:MAG TPA: arginine deiminase-related protein [Steroidobacteraceae bacterium]|nr:arginine deiminase-related protein [Steroidobacteraceae bacterium]